MLGHLPRQEIGEELLARVGEDRFGVELDAFDFVAAVTEAHDDAVIAFRGDHELARQRLPFNNERVITGGRERVRQLAEDIFAVVMDLAGFAMEKFRSADDFSAKSCTNGLVAEANTEDWKFSGKTLDELDGNARFPRRTRSGRNDNALRAAAGDFFNGDFVVAMDFDVRTELTQILREVVGKRIVVVQQQNHFPVLVRYASPNLTLRLSTLSAAFSFATSKTR